MSAASLLWFRLDLRLTDNRALLAALSHGGPVIPVFIWSPDEKEPWQPGAASRWWLHQSLEQLDGSLRQRGSRLIIRRGPVLQTIRQLLGETRALGVYWNRRYEPAVIERDRHIKAALYRDGYRAESFNSALLFEPWTVRTQRGAPHRVFSSFWQACLDTGAPGPPRPAPRSLENPRRWPESLKLRELGLEPAIDWAGGLRLELATGRGRGQARAESFSEGQARRLLAGEGSSRPRGNVAPLSSPPFRRDRAQASVGRGPTTAARSFCFRGMFHTRARLARICPPSPLPLSAHAGTPAPRELRRFSLAS